MTYKHPNKKVYVKDLGLIGYKKAWAYQKKVMTETVDKKLIIINKMKANNHDFEAPANHLLFCQHPHVYTIGKTGHEKHLLLNQNDLINKQVDYFKTDRGGDITYHGPGQIVGYPILDLYNFFTDIHRYLRCIEEVIILTLQDYGVKANTIKGLTGVWIKDKIPRKICAIGVKASRWITMHGFAFNVNTNLDYFNYIIPCGIQDKGVTSLAKELSKKIDIEEVKFKIINNMSKVFGFSYPKY